MPGSLPESGSALLGSVARGQFGVSGGSVATGQFGALGGQLLMGQFGVSEWWPSPGQSQLFQDRS